MEASGVFTLSMNWSAKRCASRLLGAVLLAQTLERLRRGFEL